MAHTPDRLRARRQERAAELRRRRRRFGALVAAALLALVAGAVAGAGGGDRDPGEGSADEGASPEEKALPTGGRRIFPDNRVVAFYGAPQDPALGVLGIGSPATAAEKLARQGKPYATEERPVLPAFELIAVVAADAPGEGDLYRTRQGDAVIARYLRAARRAKALLLLDVQPGRADFLTEAKALERWLKEPDVGLALDPEWSMEPGEVPGQTIGSVDAGEVNAVSAYLSDLVRREGLPEKLLAVHRFTEEMVERPEALERPAGVAVTLNADGFGTKVQKLAKYDELVPARFRAGFKLFYTEDTGLMSPREVLAVRPQPDLIVYE